MQERRIGGRAIAGNLHVSDHGRQIGSGAVDDLNSGSPILQEVPSQVPAVAARAPMPADPADHPPTSSLRIRVSSSAIASAAVTDAAVLVAFATLAS